MSRPTASAFREALIEREIVNAASNFRPRPTSFLQSREGERTTCGFHPEARSQMMSNLQATTQAMRAYAQRGIPAADVEPPLESHGTIPLAARPPLFQPKWIPNGLIRLTTDCRQSPPHDILKASRAVAKMLKSGAPAAASSIIRMDEQQCVTNHRLCHTELLEKRTQQ